MTTKEIQVLFDNWGFSRAAFARMIGMPRSTFYNKMDPEKPQQFRPSEIRHIELCLSDLKKQLPDG